MNYKSFNLGDWIEHINGVIEDESELDGDEMRDLVEFLTTLNQELRWIPVSERLPEDKETVLVTFKHFVCGNTIGLGSVILLRGKPHWHVREQDLGTYDVLAWMPLSEPYKAESEE